MVFCSSNSSLNNLHALHWPLSLKITFLQMVQVRSLVWSISGKWVMTKNWDDTRVWVYFEVAFYFYFFVECRWQGVME